jgi:hypothetical protein
METNTAAKAMHVDDFVCSYTRNEGEIYAAWLLMYFRMPAVLKMKFSHLMSDFKLYCTWQNQRWEVTGASRLGDVCLKLISAIAAPATSSYDKRAAVGECSDWAATVDGKLGLNPNSEIHEESLKQLQLKCNRLSETVHYLLAGIRPIGSDSLQDGDLDTITIKPDFKRCGV